MTLDDPLQFRFCRFLFFTLEPFHHIAIAMVDLEAEFVKVLRSQVANRDDFYPLTCQSVEELVQQSIADFFSAVMLLHHDFLQVHMLGIHMMVEHARNNAPTGIEHDEILMLRSKLHR